jgi:cell division transport system ATP-binding protein
MSYSLAQDGQTISMANRRLEFSIGSCRLGEKDSHRHRRKRLILREAAEWERTFVSRIGRRRIRESRVTGDSLLSGVEEPVVQFENVGMRYGLGPEVLSDVSFQIAPRSFQFLTGPSGAGKTTLLRLILLSVRPTRGLVSVFGEEVSDISNEALTGLRRRMGIVFQDFRLLDHLTTYENVALPLRVQGRSETSYRAEVVELLRWVGLGERMHVLPPLLSGGEKQRAAIARALIARPDLLLADEPTGNVDPGLGRRLLRLFIELNRLGTSVLIATHDFGLMDLVDAPRLVLGQGRLQIER